MVKTKVYCDVCGEELKIIQKHTLFGDVNVIKTSRTKQLNTSRILPHLCENCALKIDNELLEAKLKMLQRSDNNGE